MTISTIVGSHFSGRVKNQRSCIGYFLLANVSNGYKVKILFVVNPKANWINPNSGYRQGIDFFLNLATFGWAGRLSQSLVIRDKLFHFVLQKLAFHGKYRTGLLVAHPADQNSFDHFVFFVIKYLCCFCLSCQVSFFATTVKTHNRCSGSDK